MGSRIKYDSTKNKANIFHMSVDVKTTATDGIIFFAQQSDGSETMAVYIQKGKVITNESVIDWQKNIT